MYCRCIDLIPAYILSCRMNIAIFHVANVKIDLVC